MDKIEQYTRFDNIPHCVNPAQLKTLINELKKEQKADTYSYKSYFYVLARLEFIQDVINYLVIESTHRLNDIYDNNLKPPSFKHKRLLMKRSEVYHWLKKIYIYSNVGLEVKDFFKKTTRPKTIHARYTKQAIASILSWCKRTYLENHDTSISMWQTIRYQETETLDVDQQHKHLLKTLSYATLLKWLKTTNWYNCKRRTPMKTHPSIKEHDPLMIHMDIKYIRREQTAMNKEMYILDFKSAKLKLYYGEIIETRSGANVMSVLSNALLYFKMLGYAPTTIRTDNGSEFKISSDVINMNIEKYLAKKHIRLQYIPPHTPQANGIIERQHRCVENEFLSRTAKVSDLATLRLMYEEYIYYYNTKRYHTIITWHNNKRKISYSRPIELLEMYKKSLKLQN